jgi:outer membrane protein insertion porin family
LRRGGLVFLSLLLSALPSLAHADNVIIAQVVVEGAVSSDVQLIKNVSGLNVGQSIAREDLQKAVHQVYGLGLFEDVHIEGEDVSGQLKAIIVVKELPRMVKLVLKGNEKIKEKDFSLQLKQGQKIGPSQLKEAERLIRQAYQKKGYYLVTIKSETVPTGVEGEVNAVITIDEHNSVKVAKVEFVGNRMLEAEDLQKKMSNKPRGFLRSIFGGGHFNREKYSDDLKAITDYYRKKGYLDAVIVSDTIITAEDKSNVTIRIEVNEGSRYHFGTSSFVGDSILPEHVLRHTLKYSEGDVYNQEKFDKSEEEIYNAYMEEGHLYVRVVEDTKTVDSTVNLTYEISEGVPAHVNRIDIIGNSKTKDKVIRRELVLYPGQTFRRSLLQRSMRNVMLLNYFSNVTPEFHQLPDGRVDLSMRVEEKPTGQIQVGGGYSEQDKFVGTMSLGIPNLMGNGQTANITLELGKLRQSYQLSFTEPWFLDTPTSLGFDISKLDRIYDDPYITGTNNFTEKSAGFSTRLGRRLRWPDDYFSAYTSYKLENIKYSDFSDSTQAQDFANSNGVISSVSFTATRDSRDLPEFATKGTRGSYNVEFTGGLLGGDWSYTKHTFSYSFYKKIWKGIVFSPTWNVGLIQAGAGRTQVPFSELFYGGGIRSDAMIRGYDDQSIVAFEDTATAAPRQSTINGDLIEDVVTGRKPVYNPVDTVRGQALYVMNAQVFFPIVSQQIHGLLFYDAGNVWLHASEIDPFNVFTSYGFGFRLQVPGVGLLGFDFGFPLKGSQKGKLKPHFQFGSSF